MPLREPAPPREGLEAEMYAAGRRLVKRDGVRLDALVWDADEVLWGWFLSVDGALRRGHRVVRGDLGHRERFRLKPGVFALLLGMQDAAREDGHDPYMRIWTNGYPWRLWKISEQVPELQVLLGPYEGREALDHDAFIHHPRVFSRLDYAAMVEGALQGELDAALAALPGAARAQITAHLARTPLDSTLKLPELATLRGKAGFARSRVLIDDQPDNVARFVRSGRAGVHVVSHPPRILGGRLGNAVWRDHAGHLDASSTRQAAAIAGALSALGAGSGGRTVRVRPRPLDAPHVARDSTIEVLDGMVRAEWIEPMRRLRSLVTPRRRWGLWRR